MASLMAPTHFPTAVIALRTHPLTCFRVGISSVKPSNRHGRSISTGINALAPVAGFGWDDVVRAAERDDDDPSDLRGYFQRVQSCNRGSLYPVTSSFGKQILFSLERAAAPYFGIKAYGVHMNGYVVKNGQKYLWVGKRCDFKPTCPGMLDHLVAGGLAVGITCKENLVKECEEEAGIPRVITEPAISVGAVSYMDIEGYKFKRDVLFCYDLELPSDFVPANEDGEVDSFKLISVVHVANIIRRTEFFKPNCSLVIMDFLFRHGFFDPHDFGYLPLLHSLRSGNCS